MCWYCAKWERASSRSLERWKAVCAGAGNGRDVGLLLAARRAGEEIVATTSEKRLRQIVRTMADTVGVIVAVEGLRPRDGSHVTEEDRTLFNWAVGHTIAEWGNEPAAGSNLHH